MNLGAVLMVVVIAVIASIGAFAALFVRKGSAESWKLPETPERLARS